MRPGQDWALLLAMVKVILDEGLEHRQDCAELATGVTDLRRLVADADLDDLAVALRHPPRADRAASRGTSPPPAARWSVTRTGVSLHLAGTVAEWLGHVLNVITGRMDRPGGRRFEPGYVDAIRLAGMVKAKPHKSRLLGREMVAGAHALSELPDEITTPGRGQIRAMVINSGNPVVSGPDGAKLDKALGQLDLLVAIDFVQRESHRHAHWLLPAVHWLERDDLLAFTSNMHDEPYLQYGAKAVEPPPGARQEWRIFIDLAIAMRKPLFRAKGVNGFIKATRRVARLTRQARPGVRAALDRPAGGGDGTKVQRPQDQMARCHGAPARHGCWVRGSSATSGRRCGPTTRRCTRRRRSSSHGPANCSPNRIRWRRTAIRSSWPTGATGTR